MKKSLGWHSMIVFVVLATFFSIVSQAGSLSVRDIAITGKNQITIQFDGALPKNAVNLDYVRDNIQFSFQNATIYPAKMMHAESSSFNKIFAYQYSPNLVRVRFTVAGQAEQFRGKMRWVNSGKSLAIYFPDSVTSAPVKAAEEEKAEKKAAEYAAAPHAEKVELDEQKEKTLLSKVVGEEAAASSAQAPKAEKKKSTPIISANNNIQKKEVQLGGAHAGPSVARSFFAMFMIVGGLGAVLFFVKRKKNNAQVKVIGKTWWSNLLPSSMRKPKSFIEVMGTHALGPKQSIVVVKIRGQQFVLGVTQDNVQLITQLDEDESEVDVIGDPAVSESIGIMFGSRPTPAQVTRTSPASFNALLNSSTGAGAIIGRNAYQNTEAAFGATPSMAESIRTGAEAAPIRAAAQPVIVREPSIRDQIKRRLETSHFGDTRNA